MAKKPSSGKGKATNIGVAANRPRQPRSAQGIVRSKMPTKSAEDADPFKMSRGSPVTGNPDFANETGRRGAEVMGLSTGPTATTVINSAVARRRSRYAVLTSPYAKRAIEVLVSNVVGSGHKLVSLAPNTEFKKQVEDLWKKWCSECDPSGKMNFAAIEALIFRSMLEGGDSFARLRVRKKEDGLSVPLQIQLYEAEQVPVFKNERNGPNAIVAGIEFSPLGKILFYHLCRTHPGEFTLLTSNQDISSDTVAIPASEMIHLHDVKRPSEVRGLPILSQCLIQLSDLDRYMDAELVRKKAAALIGGFIREPIDGSDKINPFITGEDGEIDIEAVQNSDKSEIHIEALEPGTFPILPPGYEVSFSNPQDVGPMFEAFLRQQLLMITASVNLTYDQLTGDMRGVNDRTIRASMLEFKRIAMNYQANILEHQFCRAVFARWFNLAILSGALKIPAGMSDEDARKVQWVPDPWQYMNPKQEVDTQIAEIRAGFRSRSEVITERGSSSENVDDQIAADRKREEKLGLIYTTNPTAVTDAGNAQSTNPMEKPEPEEEDPAVQPETPTGDEDATQP